MQTTTIATNPYRLAAAALDLDRRAARVLMRDAARRRDVDIRAARRAKSARQFLAIAFA